MKCLFRSQRVAGLGLLLTIGLAWAGEARPSAVLKMQPASTEQPLKPRMVSLPAGERSLAAWLDALDKSGNRVEHLRSVLLAPSTNVTDQGSEETLAFWPAVDRLARKFQLKVERRSQPARVLLRDLPNAIESGPIAYDGPFRFQLERIQIQQDWLEPSRSHMALQIEVMWEPWLQPFWLAIPVDSIQWQAEPEQALTSVRQLASERIPLAGQTHATWVIRLPLPKRSLTHLALVEGKAKVFVSPQWLQWDLDASATKPSQKREGVAIQVKQVEQVAGTTTRRVTWLLRYPDGSFDLESHQAWVLKEIDMSLASTTPAGRTYRGTLKDVSIEEGLGMRFTHEFTDGPETLASFYWRFQVPGVPKYYPVTWRLQNIPLP